VWKDYSSEENLTVDTIDNFYTKDYFLGLYTSKSLKVKEIVVYFEIDIDITEVVSKMNISHRRKKFKIGFTQ
jgi:hypothetical protein